MASLDTFVRKIDTIAGKRSARAAALLKAWMGTAARNAQTPRDVLTAMATGAPAADVARALEAETRRAPPPVLAHAACRAGCAFCCILDGPDGGTITEAEARALHAALAPVADQPDGRGWHPAACPALDPMSRTCRAYEARPALCRAYVSTDASACETNAEGGHAAGAGLLGFHLDYLSLFALLRDTMKGTARVPSYALSRVAAAAVEGRDIETALDEARHPPAMLKAARKGLSSVAAARS